MQKQNSFKVGLLKKGIKPEEFLKKNDFTYCINSESLVIIKKSFSGFSKEKVDFFPKEFNIIPREVTDVRIIVFHKIMKNENFFWLVTMFGDCRAFTHSGKLEPTFGKRIIFNLKAEGYDIKFKLTKTKSYSQSNLLLQQKSKATSDLSSYNVSVLNESLTELKCQMSFFDIPQIVSATNTIYFRSNNNYFDLVKQSSFLMDVFLRNSYKKQYADYVDYMNIVLDQNLINILDNSLIKSLFKKINGNYILDSNIIFHWPEILQDEEEFSISGYGNQKFYNLDNDVLKLILKDAENRDKTKGILNREVRSLNNGEIRNKISFYKCISAEITINNEKIYTLFEGHWFELESKFVDRIISKYNFLCKSHLVNYFPNVIWEKNMHEDEFNKITSKKMNLINMDRLIVGFGGDNKLETADMLDKAKKRLFAVKQYKNASMISHLIFQIEHSIYSILNDSEHINSYFRNKIPEEYGDYDISHTEEFVIVIATSEVNDNIPKIAFFSKMTIISFLQNSGLYKIPIKLQSIQTK